ncbi:PHOSPHATIDYLINOSITOL TRANSFER PROTEIN [Encephalitozoon cuniculi GB-M1]|uniref:PHOSPHATIDYLINOSITOL TRANSFER PROTEIN n=2 Tax=Encephalitozoon cuniculi TaxID=6035 RepID=Q8SRW5_ENCCU|nr:phosphatidylinositol transfer protein [Encephalitozoon cuniculi GB-M1]AGE95435.1 phosphatidylinositol transfer protein [Encephalitozoon cuniculi]KMV66150.1 phosphatidylinositol transfer protein [Encephalitozoon cuniculi EcunIII-L]UYI27887.1 phosphatidylinositol transfer protein [Encephalitozoon cuniculi]CAD26613.1 PHOSPHATIDYLINOSITOL TRANSFER PROTEIN [Encephalitozoon cuniculi GB-M1]
MGKIEKIYVTVLPMTTDEYAVGHLHTVSSMTESENAGDLRVELVGAERTVHETLGKVNKTHKIMYLKPRFPRVLHSLIPEDACIVEEISYNAYTRYHTFYRNRYFSSDTFNMVFNTINRDGAEILENPFGYDPEHINQIERISLDLHAAPVNPAFDPSVYYHEESGRGRLDENWVETYKSRGMPMMVSYKHLTVEINNYMMGWVSAEIEKVMRGVITSIQQRIFCTMDKWYGRNNIDRTQEEDQEDGNFIE